MERLHKIREAAKQGEVRVEDLRPAADCPGFETLNRYFEGWCTGRERVWTETHLSRCDSCLHLMAGFVRSEEAPGVEASGTAGARSPGSLPRRRPVRWAVGLSAPVLAAAAIFLMVLTPNLRMEVSVVGMRAHQVRDAREFQVRDGDTLYSGDRVRVDFETDGEVYLYVFADSSSGDLRQLFPPPDDPEGVNRFAAGRHTIPERPWYLDDRAGAEVLYVAAAENPVRDCSALLASLRDAAAFSGDPSSGPAGDRDARQARVHALLDKTFDRVEPVRFEHR